MKKICIFLFSGTGMTSYVIDRLKNELEKTPAEIDVFLLERAEIENIKFNDYEILGIAYPVHSFNAPEIVIDFAKKLPKIESLDTFIVSTAGGDSFMNNSSSNLLFKILNKKGCNVFFDKQFIMPSNFAVKDDETEVRSKIDKVNSDIPAAADEIINRVPCKQKENCISKIISIIGRLEWIGLKTIQKFFYVTGDCNQCNLCAKNCPQNNIINDREKISFKRNCMLCMRCVYLCPKHCIKAKRAFRFITFDDWYGNMPLAYKK